MNAAEIVSKIRASLCYSQIEFGDILKVTKQTISNWELGIRKPRSQHRRQLLELAKQAKIKIQPEDFNK